jgi:hypothetical protein
MLERELQGARLLYAYTMFIGAPRDMVFHYTGDPASWARDYDDRPLERLSLEWQGRRYSPGSVMVLSPVRKDGTATPVGAVRMELIHYAENEEIAFRYLTGNHLIYRFVYEDAPDGRTEFTVNVLVDAQSPRMNTLRQRLYARRRRRDSVKDHLAVKQVLEAKARLMRG